MNTIQVFLCVVAMISCVASVGNELPSFIHPCSASDPNLNECITRTIAAVGAKFSAGIPELGIAPLDPLYLGSVPVPNPSLNLVFTDAVVTGLRDFRINAFKINLEKGKAILDFTANVTLKANYDMDGQVLILPIRGNGETKIKITNLNIVVKYDFSTVDGHWMVNNYKDAYKMDRAVFRFSNLFGGNKQLSDTTIQFINENWSLIMEEIAPPALKQIIKRCVDEVDSFFRAVPVAHIMTP